MSHPSAHTDPEAQSRTASAWATVVLAVATVALLVYVALVVAASWLVVSAVSAVVPVGPAELDPVRIAADVAPGLLVGWCTGRATAAALEHDESVPSAVAGLAAGALGVTTGAVALAFTGIL